MCAPAANGSTADQEASEFVLALALGLAIVASVLWAISATYRPSSEWQAAAAELATPEARTEVRPEPLERLLYVTAVLSLPFALAAGHVLVRRLVRRGGDGATTPVTAGAGALLLAVVAAGIALAFRAQGSFLGTYGVGRHPFALLFGVPTAAALAWRRVVVPGGRPASGDSIGRWAPRATVAAAAAFPVALSVLGVESLDDRPIFRIHFNAVFHSVAQVFLGRTILVDTSNQYGLYPHFLEPVFRLTGLGVLQFTLVLAALEVVAFVALYRFVAGATNDRPLAAIATAATVMLCFVAPRLYGDAGDPFFQYGAVRFVPAALAAWAADRWVATGSRRAYVAGHALAAAAMLWNLDTGVVVFGAWVLVVWYQAARARSSSAAIRGAVWAVLSLSAACALFAAEALIRTGQLPDVARVLRYPRIFYVSGFYMLPMPAWHPWNLVAVAYAAGLLVGLRALIAGTATRWSAATFHAAVLGTGLFSYYQGRSHDVVLAHCAWPAVALCALFAAGLFDRIRRGATPASWRAGATLLVVFLAAEASGLAGEAATVWRFASDRLAPVLSRSETAITRAASVVRRHGATERPLLILSDHSGVYALAAGRVCPIDVPGPAELLLRSDAEALNRLVATGSPVVVLDGGFAKRWPSIASIVVQTYRIRDVSPDGTLMVFSR